MRTFSLIITVFKSEANIPPLMEALRDFAKENRDYFHLECVFVVDGSPDRSAEILNREITNNSFSSQLVVLSRNFGAPLALRTGLSMAKGDYFCSIATDLQEPFETVLDAFRIVASDAADICFGQRVDREDPPATKASSTIFWTLYRKFVESNIPKGGVDLFVCNDLVRRSVLQCKERTSFFVGLLFWVGFRRSFIPYSRKKREIGKSSWSFAKRLTYLMDSVFNFSDRPIKMLTIIGGIGITLAICMLGLTVYSRITGLIQLPGYSATVSLILFFGGLNSFGLGIVGEYVWRTFENTKNRPLTVISEHKNASRIPTKL